MVDYSLQHSGAPSGSVYSLHQQQGDKTHGTSKTGYLLKKSEGKLLYNFIFQLNRHEFAHFLPNLFQFKI